VTQLQVGHILFFIKISSVKLYNWHDVNDPKGLVPVGWHIPCEAELNTLSGCLLGQSVAGGKILEQVIGIVQIHWLIIQAVFQNMLAVIAMKLGSFANFGKLGYWRTNVSLETTNSWYRRLDNNSFNLTRVNYTKSAGFSIRCVKN
jgi:uncharacterized protein (TIGR02145 family)